MFTLLESAKLRFFMVTNELKKQEKNSQRYYNIS